MANLTTAEATRQAISAQWALNQLGSRDYFNLCQRFIENAYGTGGQYASAAAASNTLMNNTDASQADVGDLVFFRPDASNGYAGHVGIYIGGGKMVGATNSGISVDSLDNAYWSNLLVGFGDPPKQWQGRTADGEMLQGAADLVAKGKLNSGDYGGAIKYKAVSAWGGAGKWINEIAAAAEKYDIPINLLAAKVNVESGGNPTARSGAGAQGLLQLMPGTARGLGVTDPNDPAQNLDAGARYFRQMYDQQGNWDDALRAYNAGPNGNWNNAETIGHVKKVNQWADTIGDAIGEGAGGPTDFGGDGEMPSSGGGSSFGPTRAQTADQRRRQNVADKWGGFWQKLQEINDSARGAAGRVGEARDRLVGGNLPTVDYGQALAPVNQAGAQANAAASQALSPVGEFPRTSPQGGPSAAGQIGDLFSGLGTAAQGAAGALGGAIGGLRGAQPPWGSGPLIGGNWPTLQNPGGGGPGGPGGPPGGGPPGGRQDDQGFLEGIAGQEARDQAGPAGTAAAPGAQAQRPKPMGWVDPTTIRNPAYMGIIGQWNQALERQQLAREQLEAARKSGNQRDIYNAQQAADAADNEVKGLTAAAANTIQAAEKEEGGQFVPGTSAGQKKWTIVKRNPQTGQWETQVIDNPGWEESATIQAQKEQNKGALERQNAADKAALARLGLSTGSAEKISAGEIASREKIAGLNATTQRVTTALSQSVAQRAQDIEAQIKAGDLSLREGTEQFNQWYKVNVEAPLAILRQQREGQQYVTQQQEAVTRRATAQAEHERGVAQLGQQMWNTASDAYTKMIPLTVGAGWGEGFQRNLQGQGYQPNQGATYDVPESLDAFATRKVAEMLKGVSPYAQSLLGAEQQMGAPGQSMPGQQMTDLTNQATNVASNALANPFQMPQLPQFQMPGQVDIAGMAGAGMGRDGQSLTNQLDQYLPSYGQNGY